MADPVRSIRALSYLDNGNLDCLDDGPGRGKQQQHVGLQYGEISLTSTAGYVSLWCVCSHVVVFGLYVRLSWYHMWMRWLL